MQPLWKPVRMFLKKLMIELPYDSAIPVLVIYPKKSTTLIGKDMCTSMFIVAFLKIAKIDTSPRKTYRGPETYENMLSITSHQGDAN